MLVETVRSVQRERGQKWGRIRDFSTVFSQSPAQLAVDRSSLRALVIRGNCVGYPNFGFAKAGHLL
jgi:hypothetical protein